MRRIASPLLALAAAAALATARAARGGAAAPAQAKPNLILMLVDDYGWNNIGYHARAQPNADEIRTPHMDDLAANGVILDRHYVYRFCSPSRSSFQTGRNPIHVNTGNDPLTLVNPQDPIAGFAGIPRNMTVLAEKLAAAGYATAMTGKWHVGTATPTHTPQGRGYEQSLAYRKRRKVERIGSSCQDR
jgi:arylsulfatase B